MFNSWNPWKLKVYMYLISCANEKETEWQGVKIKRGQTIRSLSTIQSSISYIIQYSKDTNRSRSPSRTTVQRILEDLKVKQLIDYKAVQQGMLITINNFNHLASTPFVKVVQSSTSEVVQQISEKYGGLKAPDWLLEHWGVKQKNGGVTL